MPRIIIKPRPPSRLSQKLLVRLAEELRSPGNGRLPLILEEHNATPASPSVTVIWDEWEPLSFESRFDIIKEAYRQVEGDTVSEGLDLVSGYTPEEALAVGRLPYRIVPKRGKHNKYSIIEERQAMDKEAPFTILGEGATELRYIRKEDASQAVKRLRAALPGSRWAIIDENDEEED
jgi:hypothetical protein